MSDCRAIIFRVTPGQKRAVIVQCFSDTLGRIGLAITPPRGIAISPFTLISCTVDSLQGDFGVASNLEIIDTFADCRTSHEASKSVLWIRTIVEHCLPPRAVSESVWNLVASLLGLLHTFRDWKAAPLLLALTLFEQEGASPHVLTTLPSLPETSRKQAERLLVSTEAEWREAEIPEDLFRAALETIHVKIEIAKGGT